MEKLEMNAKGFFEWSTINGKYAKAVIIDITEEYNMFLKEEEIVCRYATKTTTANKNFPIYPLIKINTVKNIAYFLDENERFMTRGTKLDYFRLVTE